MSYGMSYGPATGVDCDMQEASVITLKWDPYASETGLYTVDGCEGASPTLHLKAGSTYVFDQSDASNWCEEKKTSTAMPNTTRNAPAVVALTSGMPR